MVERVDPARTGVHAGRVVGVLTAGLAAVSLFAVQETYYQSFEPLMQVFGLDTWIPLWTVFWGNLLIAVVARYSVTYIVGSLIGVVYDWMDRPPLVVLIAIVGIVGFVDAFFAMLDTRSTVIGTGYVVAWLVYVPVFVWLFDEDAGDDEPGARRL